VRIITGRLLEKDYADAEAFEFLEDQYLIGVLPCEAVRTEDQHDLERGRFGTIAKTVEPGPIQAGPTIAVIDADIGVHDIMTMIQSEAT